MWMNGDKWIEINDWELYKNIISSSYSEYLWFEFEYEII